MTWRALGRNGGRIIVGFALLAIGGYYFLRNTLGFDLGELDEQAVWPVLAVILGAWIVLRGISMGTDEPVHH